MTNALKNKVITEAINYNVYDYLKSASYQSKLKEMLESFDSHNLGADAKLIADVWAQSMFIFVVSEMGSKLTDMILTEELK